MSESGEQSFYRDPQLRKGILRKSVEIFGSKELSAQAIDDFFLLEGEKLTKEEEGDAGRFVEYIGKRLVNASLHRPREIPLSKAQAGHRLYDPAEGFGFIPFHDPAHAIAAYERSRGRTVIPKFLTSSEQDAYTNPDVLVEEFPSLLWSRIFGGKPLFVSFLRPDTTRELVDALRQAGDYEHLEETHVETERIVSGIDYANFESVRRAYEQIISLYIKETAHLRTPKSVQAVRNGMDAAFKMSQEHPDPAYITTARNIFENYPVDKKALFREFQRICGPLLERLRRREEIIEK